MKENQPYVLVVEDQEPVRNMLGRLLQKSGLRVETVGSGEEALRLLRNEPAFDCVIADLLMPGVHGVTFLKLAKQAAPAVPLIVLTGSEISASAISLAGCEVAAYLRKPLETARLADTVLALVSPR